MNGLVRNRQAIRLLGFQETLGIEKKPKKVTLPKAEKVAKPKVKKEKKLQIPS